MRKIYREANRLRAFLVQKRQKAAVHTHENDLPPISWTNTEILNIEPSKSKSPLPQPSPPLAPTPPTPIRNGDPETEASDTTPIPRPALPEHDPAQSEATDLPVDCSTDISTNATTHKGKEKAIDTAFESVTSSTHLRVGASTTAPGEREEGTKVSSLTPKATQEVACGINDGQDVQAIDTVGGDTGPDGQDSKNTEYPTTHRSSLILPRVPRQNSNSTTSSTRDNPVPTTADPFNRDNEIQLELASPKLLSARDGSGIYYGNDEITVPPEVLKLWSTVVLKRLTIDLRSTQRRIRRRKSSPGSDPDDRNVYVELRMSGKKEKNATVVTLRPCVWIMCGSKWCQKVVQKTVRDIEWMSAYGFSEIQVVASAPIT